PVPTLIGPARLLRWVAGCCSGNQAGRGWPVSWSLWRAANVTIDAPGARWRSCSTLSPTRSRRILSIQPVAERGGSDQALVWLVRSLAGAGWECHVVLPAPSPMPEKFAAAGATLHVVPMRRITTSGSPLRWVGYVAGWPVAVVRIVRLCRRIRPDVIHSNSLHSWYGWAVAGLLRQPPRWHAKIG